MVTKVGFNVQGVVEATLTTVVLEKLSYVLHKTMCLG